MKKRTIILFIIVVLLGVVLFLVKSGKLFTTQGGGASVTSQKQSVKKDTTPPVVEITAPVQGSALSSVTLITATAKDNDTVASVVILIDGGPKKTCLKVEVCTYNLNPMSLSQGMHTITARATDSAKNVQDSTPVSITVTSPVKTTTSSGSKQNTSSGGHITSLTLSAVKATSTNTSSVTITWTTNKPATGEVSYGTTSSDAGTYNLHSKKVTTLSTAHTFTLSNLDAGAKYYFRVTSVASGGVSLTSNEYSFTVPTVTISSIKESETSGGSNSLITSTLTWKTNIATKGQILYSTQSSSSGLYESQSTTETDVTTNHSIDLLKLTPNLKYYYTIISIDDIGNKSVSSEYSFTTSTISNITLYQPSSASLSRVVAWTTSVPATSQVIYGTASSSTSTYALKEPATPNVTLVTNHSVEINYLLHNTKYFYRVVSTDGTGKKTTSDEYSFTVE